MALRTNICQSYQSVRMEQKHDKEKGERQKKRLIAKAITKTKQHEQLILILYRSLFISFVEILSYVWLPENLSIVTLK